MGPGKGQQNPPSAAALHPWDAHRKNGGRTHRWVRLPKKSNPNRRGPVLSMHGFPRICVAKTSSLQVGPVLSLSVLESLLIMDDRNLLKSWTFFPTEDKTTIIVYLGKVREGDLAKNRKPKAGRTR